MKYIIYALLAMFGASIIMAAWQHFRGVHSLVDWRASAAPHGLERAGQL